MQEFKKHIFKVTESLNNVSKFRNTTNEEQGPAKTLWTVKLSLSKLET